MLLALRARAAAALVLLAATAAPAAAQNTAAAPRADSVLSVERYLDFETVADARISPDGSRIVYTRRTVNRLEDRWESSVWIVDADGTRNRFLVKGGAPVWSPDGTRIAYTAEGEPKGTQVFVRWMDRDGPPTQVTRTAEAPGDLRWSPDGRWIGFSMFVPRPAPWRIDMPAAPAGARWTAAPRLVERLHYRADRRGFLESGFTHLFVVPSDGGTPRALTSGDWNVGYRFDYLPGAVSWSWTPDGKTVVVEGYDRPDADLNYDDADLFAVDVATGARSRLTQRRGAWISPVVSPDGRWIAFAGYPRAAQTYHAAELYVMAIDGTGMRKVSGALDRDVSSLEWAADGSGVWFTAEDRGSRNVWFASLRGGEPRAVTTGRQMVTLGPVSRGGVAAGVRTSPHEPADVVRIDLGRAGAVTRLTRVNDDLLAGVRLGEVEEVWVTSTGGARVQGWIVKPPRFDPSRKYPLILEIHGGPHSMYNVGFSYQFQSFAANDFVVLYTNPRGSTGYGSAFGNAIFRAYPSVDHHDLMAAVDTVVARGYVDAKALNVGGCSGGGVLTSWAIGHTDRFAAAAVRCPVSNWMSFAGQTDVPLFSYNFFERPFWEAPEPWLRQSPLMYVGNVKTPTLVMTGELDLRTPMAQTDEYFAALRMRGVPSALLRFEGEYHGTGSRPSNFMRTQLYMMSWYRRWAGKTAAERGLPTSPVSAVDDAER